jgi:hypothetical protein
MPAAVVHVGDGYNVDETVGNVPCSVRGTPVRGVNTTLYVPAATVMPDAVTRLTAVGLRTTSTGTREFARVVPCIGTTGDVVVVAVLLIAQ